MFARDNGNCRTNVCESNGCGPLESGRWGLLIGAGVAPAFFKNRGFTQAVAPRLGLSCPYNVGETNTLTCNNVYNVLTAPQNVFIQSACKSRNFNKLFTNGVAHVTGQISYNVCSNVQYFLEGVYDYARGNKCVNTTASYVAAPAYCQNGDCNTSCNTNCNTSCNTSCNTGCTVTGNALFTGQPASVRYNNYQAYGGYLGARYYCNRVWCDRFSVWAGFKVGMLHRRQVCATASVAAYTATIPTFTTTYNFPAACNTFTAYCKSNAVSGGVQVGVDWCINDCWTVLLGVEFVTTSPLKANRNAIAAVVDPTLNGTATATGFGNNFTQITNYLVAPTGAMFQVPVWVGVRWEFDWCKDSCNEC
jgi:hypothetical protein